MHRSNNEFTLCPMTKFWIQPKPRQTKFKLFHHIIPTLITLTNKPFDKIVGKEKNAGSQHFLLFPQ